MNASTFRTTNLYSFCIKLTAAYSILTCQLKVLDNRVSPCRLVDVWGVGSLLRLKNILLPLTCTCTLLSRILVDCKNNAPILEKKLIVIYDLLRNNHLKV